MNSTSTNARFDMTQNMNTTHQKNGTIYNYKTSKSYHLMPSYQKIKNQLFNKSDKDLLMNQRYYDPEMLKQQLNSCKTLMHEQKSTYLNLKIKYSKLYNENTHNKNLISNVLGTPLDKYLTRDEVMDKIENAKLNKKKRDTLQEAFDCIILKMEIEEKKEQNNKLIQYLKELNDNSKIKKMNDIVNDFVNKCDEQRRLLRKLKTLGEKSNSYEMAKKHLEESIEKEKTKKNEIQIAKGEKKEKYEQLMEERNNMVKQNKTLVERIKKNIMTNREKAEKIRQKELAIKDTESECEELNIYKKERDAQLKKLEEKKKLDEDIKKSRREQEQTIKKLNAEYDELNNQMSNYNEEKPKLLKKAKEPKSDIDNMKRLETKLKELKAEKERYNKLHEEKQTQLKKCDEEEKQKMEKNNDIINQNNSTKNEMNKKIDELNQKIKELEEKKESDSNNIANNNLEYENLINEEKNLKENIGKDEKENEIEIKKQKEERKKELNNKRIQQQKEIDGIKTENNNINDKNERIKKEIDNLQQEINNFDSQLNNNEDLEQQLKDAESKLKTLQEK